MLRTRLFPLNGAAKIAAGIVRRSAQRVNPSRAVHEFGNVEKNIWNFSPQIFFRRKFFARIFCATILREDFRRESERITEIFCDSHELRSCRKSLVGEGLAPPSFLVRSFRWSDAAFEKTSWCGAQQVR
jgi:hypothetical protein